MDPISGENIVEATIADILAQQCEEITREATLPFEEKIKILIRMQARTAGLRPDLNWTVWSIPESQFVTVHDDQD
jgi:hypothetical protein